MQITTNAIGIGLFLLAGLFGPFPARAADPIDLFPDAPALGPGYIRIAAWNLRHINVEGAADEFLPGQTEEEDFSILIATFAKGIHDLGLDLVAVIEHQPRRNEPNRLIQLHSQLNTNGNWRFDESNIAYAAPIGQFGGLQFGLLWNSEKITIDSTADELLLNQRQSNTLRAPWLIPVTSGQLEFDLVVLHLKSGGSSPQAAEVQALSTFIENHQTGPHRRHLIVLGDWNIRPDRSQGRGRLRRIIRPAGARRMRILTVEDLPPSLDEWAILDHIEPNLLHGSSPLAGVLPFTHFNSSTFDTFLDHIAISTSLDEVYEHPIRVEFPQGEHDLRHAIEIVRPLIPEAQYSMLTDHLPVVLTLSTLGGDTPPPANATLLIVAAIPNPPGSDRDLEEVHVLNVGNSAESLSNWRIQDATGGQWLLTEDADGTVPPGEVIRIIRRGRPASLNNDGDTIRLFPPDSNVAVDEKSYGPVQSGEIVHF